jgi:hypothetical protein
LQEIAEVADSLHRAHQLLGAQLLRLGVNLPVNARVDVNAGGADRIAGEQRELDFGGNPIVGWRSSVGRARQTQGETCYQS